MNSCSSKTIGARRTVSSQAIVLLVLSLSVPLDGCLGSGPGSDFDGDGIRDSVEDVDDDFVTDLGETSMSDADTDGDGLCDGPAPDPLPQCTLCEDCNANGVWEPCLGETSAVNADSDGDGILDARDAEPLDGVDSECGATSPE